jgi:hypothetical protein
MQHVKWKRSRGILICRAPLAIISLLLYHSGPHDTLRTWQDPAEHDVSNSSTMQNRTLPMLRIRINSEQTYLPQRIDCCGKWPSNHLSLTNASQRREPRSTTMDDIKQIKAHGLTL